MSIILEHPNAKVKIDELSEGRRIIHITSDNLTKHPYVRLETNYSIELIQKILDVKGPLTLCDEIRREEDPYYTRVCLEQDLLAYRSEQDFAHKRILDFGCGGGASSIILAKMFPTAQIVGIDISDKLISLATFRASQFNLKNISFICSKSGTELPPNLPNFDYIVLSAVLEHLLPEERITILSQLWSLLKHKSLLFINQTPYRYFPFEGHTTRLPFINYLPDKAAHLYAITFSKRVPSSESWATLLRRGIRGSHSKQILRILTNADQTAKPEILTPTRLGYRDRIDVWYNGYAVSIAKKYPNVKRIQLILKYFSKIIYLVSGIIFLPTISLAIEKKEKL